MSILVLRMYLVCPVTLVSAFTIVFDFVIFSLLAHVGFSNSEGLDCLIS